MYFILQLWFGNRRRIGKMNKILLIIISSVILTACSIKEPRLSFGKKCVEKSNKIVYSYVWLYDKKVGLPADKNTCKYIAK